MQLPGQSEYIIQDIACQSSTVSGADHRTPTSCTSSTATAHTCRWEMATSRLHVNEEMIAKADDADFADKFARVEAHYFGKGLTTSD